jgi:hypothetical protein
MRSCRIDTEVDFPDLVAGGGEGLHVVVADEPGESVGEVGVVDAGADDLHGRGGPHGVRASLAPYFLALAVGLRVRRERVRGVSETPSNTLQYSFDGPEEARS